MAAALLIVGTRVHYKDEPGMTGTLAEIVMVEKNGSKTTSRYDSGMVHMVPMCRVEWDTPLAQATLYWPSELKRLRTARSK